MLNRKAGTICHFFKLIKIRLTEDYKQLSYQNKINLMYFFFIPEGKLSIKNESSL